MNHVEIKAHIGTFANMETFNIPTIVPYFNGDVCVWAIARQII
jgi:hypothetical protein